MNQLIFNTILAVIIASCPIRCSLGWTDCCADDANVAQQDICSCCHSSNSDSIPTPAPDSPSQSCKCICSGATVPDHVDIDFSDCCQPVFEMIGSLATGYCDAIADNSRPPDYSVDNGQRNIGRAVRCLHCSLII